MNSRITYFTFIKLFFGLVIGVLLVSPIYLDYRLFVLSELGFFLAYVICFVSFCWLVFPALWAFMDEVGK